MFHLSSQDTAGNDAASFTTGEDGVPAVSLGNAADPVAPDAPAGLEADAAGDTRIDLAWEPPAYNGGTAVTGYRIERSPDGTDGSWLELAAHHAAMEDGEVVTAYPDHTLPASNTERHYRVSAINAAGPGPASNVASATTGTGAPGAPREPAATAKAAVRGDADTRIDLAWTAPEAIDGVAAPTGYLIEWSPDGTSDWQYLLRDEEGDPSAVTGTTYSDRGLAPETERYYRVSAINGDGTGPASGTAFATTPRFAALAPTGLTATAGAALVDARFVSRIDLAWSAPGDTGNSDLTGYLIEWSPDGTDGSWQALVADTGNLDVAFADGPLDPGTTRHYRVFAINDDGAGRVSDIDSATTRPVPREAGTNAGGTQVAIVFEPALDGMPARAPALERFTVSVDGVAVEIGALVVAGPSGQVLLNDVSPIIRYKQTVTVGYTDPTDGDDPRAVQDTAGLDAHSFADFPVINASNVLAVVAEAPIGLMAEAPSDRDDAIELRWSPPGYDGGRAVTGYRVEWSRNGRSNWRDLVPNTGETVGETCSGTPPEDGVAYCDSGLGPRTTRHYRVRAINAVGTGPASNVAHATTTEDVPGAPTGLTATAVDAMPNDTTTQIDLAWSAPDEIEIRPPEVPTGYRIEVSDDGGATFTDLVPDTGEREGETCAGMTPQDGVAYCDTGLTYRKNNRPIRVSKRVCRAVERVEDAALLAGRGRFTDDIGEGPGTAHAAVLRSPEAHAEIVSVDATAAPAMSEVVTVLTGNDVVAWSRAPRISPLCKARPRDRPRHSGRLRAGVEHRQGGRGPAGLAWTLGVGRHRDPGRLSRVTQFSPIVVIEKSPPSGDLRGLFGADEPGLELVLEPEGAASDSDGDGVVLARKTGAGTLRRPVLVALGVRPDGRKEIIDFRLARGSR